MFCFLYFKSIFIKTITSFLFGIITHLYLLKLVYYTNTGVLHVYPTNYKICIGSERVNNNDDDNNYYYINNNKRPFRTIFIF